MEMFGHWRGVLPAGLQGSNRGMLEETHNFGLKNLGEPIKNDRFFKD